MKASLCVIPFLLAVLGAAPASAEDDLAAICKANPPTGLPPGAAANNDGFCECIDKETAGNDKLRAEFIANFKLKELQQRMAAASDEAKSVVTKCRTR